MSTQSLQTNNIVNVNDVKEEWKSLIANNSGTLGHLTDEEQDIYLRHALSLYSLCTSTGNTQNTEIFVRGTHTNGAPVDIVCIKIDKTNNENMSSLLQYFGATVSYSTKITLPSNNFALKIHRYTVTFTKGTILNYQTTALLIRNLKSILKKEFQESIMCNLVTSIGMELKFTFLLSTYFMYGWQLCLPGFIYHSNNEEVFVKYPTVSQFLVEHFDSMFNPDKANKARTLEEAGETFMENLGMIQNPEERSLFGIMFQLINATVRTNLYTEGFNQNKAIALKINNSLLPQGEFSSAKPVPFAEIFVAQKSFYGLHLRGGSIARGGLRLSSRGADMRKEIFGLYKTQVVKNTVIVPTGAKGGFYVFNKDATQEEIIQCYKIFISSLLDVTDNIVDGTVVQPPNVITLDPQDPYLVVAADKGTAKFSDYANEVAKKYNFWLGDAFASGGKNGYDHKGLGITARGTWVSVQRQLAELGIDPIKDEITMVGIGGMKGDVFGNGLLSSNKIKLLAAFAGKEIFLDPSPNAEESFKERKRMFDNELDWHSYNSSLLSEGGTVFSRDKSDIKISSQAAKMLGLPEEITEITQTELLRRILKMKVDVLWTGGIGTYMKSSLESSEDAADPENDTIRINGNEVGATCVGEGANLAFTQLARKEYSLNNGQCYTDAIDNSGGVNCSDHEVNIKIAISVLKNITVEQRNQIIKDCEQDVVNLVLRDNAAQSMAIGTLFHMNGKDLSMTMKNFINKMGDPDTGVALDRSVNFLPSDTEIDERAERGISLLRPELAVLLQYGKMFAKKEMTNFSQSFFNMQSTEEIFEGYFPTQFKNTIGKEALNKHMLKKEICINAISNEICNFCGPTFLTDIATTSESRYEDIVQAYLFLRKISNLDTIINQMFAIDNILPQWKYKQINRITHSLKLCIILLLAMQKKGKIQIKNLNEDLYLASTIMANHQTLQNIFGNQFSNMVESLKIDNVPENIITIASIMFLHKVIMFSFATTQETPMGGIKSTEEYAKILAQTNTPSLRSILYAKSFASYKEMKEGLELFVDVCLAQLDFCIMYKAGKANATQMLVPAEVINTLSSETNVASNMKLLLKTFNSFILALK